MTELNNKFGEVKISDEVIAKVASVAVSEVSGTVGICDSTSGLFGIKNKTRGVRVETKDGALSIDIDIAVEYGANMADVSWEVQDKIKKAVESMTGLEVLKINILVKGIEIPVETTEE